MEERCSKPNEWSLLEEGCRKLMFGVCSRKCVVNQCLEFVGGRISETSFGGSGYSPSRQHPQGEIRDSRSGHSSTSPAAWGRTCRLTSLPVRPVRHQKSTEALKKKEKARLVMYQVRAELCERRGGRPGLSVPNSPYGLCGRKATLNLTLHQVTFEVDCKMRTYLWWSLYVPCVYLHARWDLRGRLGSFFVLSVLSVWRL